MVFAARKKSARVNHADCTEDDEACNREDEVKHCSARRHIPLFLIRQFVSGIFIVCHRAKIKLEEDEQEHHANRKEGVEIERYRLAEERQAVLALRNEARDRRRP